MTTTTIPRAHSGETSGAVGGTNVRKAVKAAAGRSAEETPEHLNNVQLCGRLAAQAERRELPSGDLLVVFRLIVDRPAEARGHVDTIDCATASGRVRQTLERAGPGEVLAVEGQLRRRFWRGPAGPTSRYEVEVTAATRVAPPGRSRTRATGRRSGSLPSRRPAWV